MPYKNKEDRKKHFLANKDRINTRRKAYRAKNRERFNEKQRERTKLMGSRQYPGKKKEWVSQNKERSVRCSLKRRVKFLYGIPRDKFEDIRHRAETEACEICGQKPSRRYHADRNGILHIDHPREEKRMRGLLCYRCNLGLGHFKDSIENLRAAINYLTADLARRVSA
jgi:hypothetical protein